MNRILRIQQRPWRIFFSCASLMAMACAACTRATSQEPSGVPSSAQMSPPPAASQKEAAPERQEAPIAPGPREPLPWGTRPDPQAPLAYVADGFCFGMDVSLLPDATFVHEGGSTVARVTDEGIGPWEETSRGLGGHVITGITGAFPDNAWLQMNDGGRAFDLLWYARWSKDHWAPALGKPGDSQHQYDGLTTFGNAALAIALGDPENPKGVSVAASGMQVPSKTGGFQPVKIVAFGADAGMVVGRVCAPSLDDKPCPFQARRFATGSATQIDALGNAGNLAKVHAAVRTPADVALSLDDRVLRFDGAKWTPLQVPSGPKEWDLHFAPDGALWAASTSKVVRITASGQVLDVSPPKALALDDELVPVLDGVEIGAPYAALENGALVRFEAPPVTAEGPAAWKPVPLPRSPFSWGEPKAKVHAARVHVRSSKDVWVLVKYLERPPHYANEMSQERRALLRTIPPAETLVCEEHGKGFLSWPPLADASCPRKLIIPLGAPDKGNKDLASSRKIVTSRKGLAGAAFVEFTVAGKKMTGLRVPDYAAGKSLLSALKAVPYTMHELVCADPTDLQELDPTAL